MNHQTSPPISEDEYQEIFMKMMSLKLPNLKAVARTLSIGQSGRKADVQDRVRRYLQIGKDNNDRARVFAIKQIVQEAATDPTMITPFETLYHSYAGNQLNRTISNGSNIGSSQGLAQPAVRKPWLFFKANPFFVPKKLVTQNAGFCARAPESRGQGQISFSLTDEDYAKLTTTKNFKLFLLCGPYDRTKPNNDVNIEFPQPLEIHFNNVQIKDNVKGIKNKPGTAKPANLTPHIRRTGVMNDLKIIYAFTKVDYLIFCYIVEEVSPDRLLQKILANPHITKEVTMREFNQDDQDEDDIQEMMTRLSLKCPLSFGRIKYPFKSIYCNHLSCFDGLSFIYLQEQASTWQCPICYKPVQVKELSVSDYVLEILKQTPEDVEQVEIDIDGSWKPVIEEEEQPPKKKAKSETPAAVSLDDTPDTPKKKAPPSPIIISLDSDDDDEIVAIEPSRPSKSAQTPQHTQTSSPTQATQVNSSMQQFLSPVRDSAQPTQPPQHQSVPQPNNNSNQRATDGIPYRAQNHIMPLQQTLPQRQHQPDQNHLQNRHSQDYHQHQGQQQHQYRQYEHSQHGNQAAHHHYAQPQVQCQLQKELHPQNSVQSQQQYQIQQQQPSHSSSQPHVHVPHHHPPYLQQLQQKSYEQPQNLQQLRQLQEQQKQPQNYPHNPALASPILPTDQVSRSNSHSSTASSNPQRPSIDLNLMPEAAPISVEPPSSVEPAPLLKPPNTFDRGSSLQPSSAHSDPALHQSGMPSSAPTLSSSSSQSLPTISSVLSNGVSSSTNNQQTFSGQDPAAAGNSEQLWPQNLQQEPTEPPRQELNTVFLANIPRFPDPRTQKSNNNSLKYYNPTSYRQEKDELDALKRQIHGDGEFNLSESAAPVNLAPLPAIHAENSTSNSTPKTPVPPPHTVNGPAPSSFLSQGQSKTPFTALANKQPAKAPSASSSTVAQNQLKEKLETHHQKNLERSNTVQLPVRRGSSDAMAHIRNLNSSLQRTMSHGRTTNELSRKPNQASKPHILSPANCPSLFAQPPSFLSQPIRGVFPNGSSTSASPDIPCAPHPASSDTPPQLQKSIGPQSQKSPPLPQATLRQPTSEFQRPQPHATSNAPPRLPRHIAPKPTWSSSDPHAPNWSTNKSLFKPANPPQAPSINPQPTKNILGINADPKSLVRGTISVPSQLSPPASSDIREITPSIDNTAQFNKKHTPSSKGVEVTDPDDDDTPLLLRVPAGDPDDFPLSKR